jgi:Fur family iron response transcriptional regulator|tara:strand:+ start:62 stop:490 length:429 start_codon:yes stop_codon:yes gene_type:complete
MNKKKDLASKLRTSGLRPTKQRLKLADFLFNREKTFHFTVENLDRAINKKNSEDKIALATIYNTVHAFKNAGHLKEILIKEGKNYFDTNTSSHHHFYDKINNELTDIENSKIELKKFPHPPKGKSIKDVNVIIQIDNDNQKH